MEQDSIPYLAPVLLDVRILVCIPLLEKKIGSDGFGCFCNGSGSVLREG